ncbi:hypothetical protein [Aeromicrobium sp. CTD01-1L150]|uniref:hypothetical protein n=1 Tax=Aeromicrobium sp. CTD01-1L150 TaxID=3341830 RepID=UPI0035C08481
MNRRPPQVPLERANAARQSAQRYRAEWLVAIASEVIDVHDLIVHASAEEGAPLRKLRLRQVLMAKPAWGPVVADQMLARLGEIVETGRAPLTVGWLIDSRTAGRRLLAWLDVNHPRGAPTPNFPYMPLREEVRR